MNTLKNFREICFWLYFRETIYINVISRSSTLNWYIICLYCKSLKFFSGTIAESFRENCSWSREIKMFFQYLKWIPLAIKFPFQWYIQFVGVSFVLRKLLEGGRGVAPRTTSISYSPKVCSIIWKAFSFVIYLMWFTTEIFHTPYSDAYEFIFRQINYFPGVSIQRNKTTWNSPCIMCVQYIGGCSVHRGDIMMHVGEQSDKAFQFILKTPMYSWYPPSDILPHASWYIPDVLNIPNVLMISPRCTYGIPPMY